MYPYFAEPYAKVSERVCKLGRLRDILVLGIVTRGSRLSSRHLTLRHHIQPSIPMSFRLGLDDSDSDSDLPFPAPLSRDAFSSTISTFSPHAFLASLRNRHLTLEDLRSDLRTRSRDLESELVELVNRDYSDFVGLGSSVKGGENKVQDLKVGLLGFRRELESIIAVIEGTKAEIGKELRKREGIRKEKVIFLLMTTLNSVVLIVDWC
jgi:hypothetical protein